MSKFDKADTESVVAMIDGDSIHGTKKEVAEIGLCEENEIHVSAGGVTLYFRQHDLQQALSRLNQRQAAKRKAEAEAEHK